MPQADRPVLAASAGLFVLLVGLQIHGFSLAQWHRVLGTTESGGVLLGSSRWIRVDDYAAFLPLALAQAAHDPPFPVVNENIGMGENMLAPLPLPVAHPVTIFRPGQWGFFLGPDFGVAWKWWFLSLGLFVVWHHVLLLVAGGRRMLAGLGAALLVCSPFVQFWTLVPAPAALAAGMCILAAFALFHARGVGTALAAGAWLGWSGGYLALTLYLPFVVPMTYLGATLVLALALARPRPAGGWGAPFAGAMLALGISSLAVAIFLIDAGDVVDRIVQTVYPGERTGGGQRPLWALLNANFSFAWRVRGFGELRNICEAASFWLFSPVAAAVILLRSWKTRVRPDAVTLALLGFSAGAVWYCVLGVPDWFGQVSLLSRSPGKRAVIAVGFADVLLVARLLSLAPAGPLVGRLEASAIASGFVTLLAVCTPALRRTIPELGPAHLVSICAVNGVLAYGLARRTHPAAFLGSLLLLTAASTMWFNPVARGGVDQLRELPLSRAILDADREVGGASFWLAYTSPVASNLFRLLGVRSLSGVHTAPQFEIWDRVDPTGSARHIYNRYAYVALEPGEGPGVRFELRRQDGFTAAANPRFWKAHLPELTHVLSDTTEPERFARDFGLLPIGSAGEHHLFRFEPSRGE